jgi:hypothetical protein
MEEPIFSEKIQETMLGPLWARAKYIQAYPEFLYKKKQLNLLKI